MCNPTAWSYRVPEFQLPQLALIAVGFTQFGEVFGENADFLIQQFNEVFITAGVNEDEEGDEPAVVTLRELTIARGRSAAVSW
ncbi:hypothetical protein C0J29_14525 [Mycobacterium paragordonae]|uniref:Uncharacterized protein n=1 Tax=Mycobacterium paragordonae TaxID=1389713 RepID=A0ABQ1C3X4_9MYCO|nr:hypothetical protein [Mycobacterium paragordonae]AYE95840.1 hypothetical protein C0J29_14525 [Mycobacterium paragordonae]GFG79138.1 hypothetical protein MPRG_24140 [Mycobacterium paragordonae]